MSAKLTYKDFESKYRDKSYIGSGGFAKVFKVFDHAKNHYVALKVADVKPEWNKFTLRKEVELVNSLPEHRNIARYDACYRFDRGLDGEIDYAILRFYEYGNLEQFLTKEKQQLTKEDKRLIIRGILNGIAFLHEKNVIHRDLKSQNILMHREDGVWTPKITDFGLSRQTSGNSDITNSAIGLSYAYAAPEQIKNHKIYKNVDLWAVGVLIYRIIVDELPFKGRDGGDEKSTQSQLVLSRKIVHLELPEKLSALEEPYQSMVKKCLVLSPVERVQSAYDLIKILEGGEIEAPAQMSAPSTVEDTSDQTQIFTPPPLASETPAVASQPLPQQIDEHTQIIPPQTPKPKATPPSTTSTFPDKKSSAAPKSSSPPPPSYPSITQTPQYESIPPNPTQIISAQKQTEEVITNTYEPKTGDPRKSGKWLLIFLPIFLLGLIGGAGYYFQEEIQKLFEPKTSTEISPTPQKPKNIKEKMLNPTFNDLNRDNEKARRENTLKEMRSTILTQINEYKNKYRPLYIMAKNKAYNNEMTEAFDYLEKSANVAIANQSHKKLLTEMEKDEYRRLKSMVENSPENWKKIVNKLSSKK